MIQPPAPVRFAPGVLRHRFDHRSALTLLELLVVLIILAIVATVAVNSLQPQVESARFDQVRKTLHNVQESAIGMAQLRQVDGTPLVSGFVADIGRLPRPQPELETGGNELAELWETECALAQSFPFEFRRGPEQPEDLSDIQLPCGWRGPYLHLPLGQRDLLDPWSRPFIYEFDSDACVGSMRWDPVPPFDQELKCDLTTGKVTVSGTLNFGQVESSTAQVVLLTPDPESSLTHLSVLADEDSQMTTFLFSEVPVGLRAIRVILDDRQVTKYIQVPHQGLSLIVDINQGS